MTESTLARNEPCSCGSGKKFKRCCGVDAPPKITARAASHTPGGVGGVDPSQFDPAMLQQMTQALTRLPRGQMQKLQSLMQKAMLGKDVSQEAKAFEATLPVEFQSLLGQLQTSLPESATQPTDATPQTPAEESRFAKAWKGLFRKKS